MFVQLSAEVLSRLGLILLILNALAKLSTGQSPSNLVVTCGLAIMKPACATLNLLPPIVMVCKSNVP
jgi:hypothetical protein